jgi:hypothetical protein
VADGKWYRHFTRLTETCVLLTFISVKPTEEGTDVKNNYDRNINYPTRCTLILYDEDFFLLSHLDKKNSWEQLMTPILFKMLQYKIYFCA